jgi:hypothetical protein
MGITTSKIETHDAAVRRKRLQLSGVKALLATWEPYAQREVDGGHKWGDASNIVRHLKARQRSIKMQLLYMGQSDDIETYTGAARAS